MLVAVTGAGGFLGSALVRVLLEHGHQVRALLRPGGSAERLQAIEPGQRPSLSEADITDPAAMQNVLSDVELLFHAAGLHSLTGDEKLHTSINVLGTRTVLAAAKQAGVRRVVVTSSATTVGSATADSLATEESVWDLGSLGIPYFTSKFLAEVEALRAAALEQDVVIVNPSTMVGERANSASPTARWLVEYLNGRLVAVPPVYMNISDVDDVARGHLAAAEHGKRGERYLLTHWNTTAEEFFTRIGCLVGRRPPLVVPYEVAFAGATVSSAVTELLGLSENVSSSLIRFAHNRMWASNRKAVRELNFTVSPVEDSLEKTVRWFNASGLVKRRL
jgi:dihydroflavonol-4-reductase